MAQINFSPTSRTYQKLTTWRYSQKLRLSSLLLHGCGLLVALLMLVTPLYLVLRTAEAGSAALDLMLTAKNAAIWGRTILLCASVTVASAVIAIPLAWLTMRTDLPFRRFWSITAALPLVIPSYICAYLFISMFGPRGTLQGWLEPLFGIEKLPNINGFWGAFFVLTLISYPYTYLSVRAGIARLDPALVEAGRSLGLNARQAFWRIILPQLRPSIIAGSLLVALYTLRDFGAVMLLRYNTFTRAIYIQYGSLFDRSLAAALALQLVLLTGVLLYIDWRSRGRARYSRSSIGVARKMVRQPLGKWKVPALGFVTAVVSLSLLMPMVSLVYWLVRGLVRGGNGVDATALIEPAVNSLTAASLAAVLTVCAAIPVALLAVRRSNRVSRFVEQMMYAGYALPGIVIALAVVFIGANYATPIYQTLLLLVLAYVILFVPQAVGTVRSSLLQISPSVEEAAQSLGESRLGVFRRVTFPLLRPGVLTGGALVFLTCMKELPATLILSPLGFTTLSQAVWTNIAEAFFAQAAFPTLLLIILSSVPLAILNSRKASSD